MASESAELSAVIGDIYDAAIDPALWQRALGSICAFVGGSSAALLWHDSAKERSEALHLFNVDPYYLRLYFEKYLPLNLRTFSFGNIARVDDDRVDLGLLEQVGTHNLDPAPGAILGE